MTHMELKTLIGCLQHVANILTKGSHFLNHLCSTEMWAACHGGTWLTQAARSTLHIWLKFLIKAAMGIDINTIVSRLPDHIIWTDACEHGLSGYNLKTGWAWRYKIPDDCIRSKSINFLEFLACIIGIVLDVFESNEASLGDCYLSVSDNTSLLGWLHHSNFATEGEQTVHSELAHFLPHSWQKGDFATIASGWWDCKIWLLISVHMTMPHPTTFSPANLPISILLRYLLDSTSVHYWPKFPLLWIIGCSWSQVRWCHHWNSSKSQLIFPALDWIPQPLQTLWWPLSWCLLPPWQALPPWSLCPESLWAVLVKIHKRIWSLGWRNMLCHHWGCMPGLHHKQQARSIQISWQKTCAHSTVPIQRLQEQWPLCQATKSDPPWPPNWDDQMSNIIAMLITFHQLILLAFFYTMHSCKYLKINSGKQHMKPICLHNLVFQDCKNQIISHNDPQLDFAATLTITFEF